MTIRGTPGQAVIDCNRTEMSAIFYIKSLKKSRVTLFINNLEIRNVFSPYQAITIENANLLVLSCVFKNIFSDGTLSISGHARRGSVPHLMVQNTKFFSNTNAIKLQDFVNADIEIANSSFLCSQKWHNCKGIFVSSKPYFPKSNLPDYLNLRVRNCNFGYNNFGIIFTGFANHTDVSIEGSTFIGNIATRAKMILDRGAGLRIMVNIYKKQRVNFIIKNSDFRDNKANAGGGFDILMNPDEGIADDNVFNFSFIGVHFQNNTAAQAGGAAYVSCYQVQNMITFRDCTFDSNSVISDDPDGRTSQLFIPAETGAGGAIAIDSGNLLIERSHFVNNTATVFGSSICSRANISLRNVGIIGSSLQKQNPTIGDLFYSEESAQLVNVTFRVINTVDGVPSVWQKTYDKYGSVDARNVRFICPIGFNVKSIKVQSYTKPKNYYVLIYYCLSCPVNTYSLLYGQETLQRQNASIIKIRCFDCPFGAICNPTIKARPNFWGFTSSDKQPSVKLTVCPREYCCSSNCKTIDSCGHNRTGSLCGRCKKGYSDNLLNSQCTLNSDCTDVWIWFAVPGLGIVYIIFFLYVEEIVSLIQTILWPFETPFGRDNKAEDEMKVEEEQQIEPLPRQDREEQDQHQEQEQQPHKPSSSFVSSLLKVILYFYQLQFVLDVENVILTNDIKSSMKSAISDIFSFRVTRQIVAGCPVPGFTPVTKLIFKVSFNLYLYIILLILYVIIMLRKHLKKKPEEQGEFTARLSRCTITIILLNYATFADVSLTMLKCVQVQDRKVLFIDGETSCFTAWQYVVMAYFICFIAPVFLCLLIGIPLLNSKVICAKDLLLSLVIPVPFIFLFAWRLTKPLEPKGSVEEHEDKTHTSNIQKAVLQVLAKPFVRENGSGPMYWEGVLLLRRFIFVVVVICVSNGVIRLYVLLAIIIIMLTHHHYVKPFRYPSINMAETVSLLMLALLCAINAFLARNLTDGQQLQGMDILLAQAFEWIVTIIALAVPVALILIVLSAIIVRLVHLFYVGMKKLICLKNVAGTEAESLLKVAGQSYDGESMTRSKSNSPLQEPPEKTA